MTAPVVCHADEAAVLRARVVSHDHVAEATWRIRLDCPSIAARAVPGQFAMLRLPDRCDDEVVRTVGRLLNDLVYLEGEALDGERLHLFLGNALTRCARIGSLLQQQYALQ